MNYADGQLAKLGDRVQLWVGCKGIIVCSIDTREYSEAYPEDEWGHLGQGVVIGSDAAGLVHIIEPDEDLLFLGRAVGDKK
jgi:hypothetical protein